MSEYQYYEFQAVDRSLTPEQMSQLRKLSTRATITSNSLSNTYHFGDFGGNPRKLMETYFDAHVYVSNFGTVTFLLRLPLGVLSEDTLSRYAIPDSLDWWSTKNHTILEWQRNEEEPPDEWVDGEGWMAQLLPLRDELVRGDYRSLYIGWLSSIAGKSPEEDEEEQDDWEDEQENGDSADRREPLVPPGLGTLTGSQAALANFLGVGIDLIAAAATASPEMAAKVAPEQNQVEPWVAQLSESELRAIVGRIIQGEGLRVQTELQSRFYRARHESTQGSLSGSGKERRTADDLLAQAATMARERQQREREAQKRKRHDQLAGLVPRFPELWATVNALAGERQGTPYDKACSLLVDLRDAYAQADRRPEFDTEFTRFLEQHGRSAALMRRLREARLAS